MAIIKGVLIGMPAGIIGLTLAVFLITDNDLINSFARRFCLESCSEPSPAVSPGWP